MITVCYEFNYEGYLDKLHPGDERKIEKKLNLLKSSDTLLTKNVYENFPRKEFQLL